MQAYLIKHMQTALALNSIIQVFTCNSVLTLNDMYITYQLRYVYQRKLGFSEVDCIIYLHSFSSVMFTACLRTTSRNTQCNIIILYTFDLLQNQRTCTQLYSVLR